MLAVDVDLEIARWVLDYIREKGSVLEPDVVREFFPDDPDTASAYLDFLKNGRAIYRSHRLGRGYRWFPVSDGNPADSQEKQFRSRWGQFMDGEVYELTAEEIRELTGENTTPHQFERRLRAHASNYGLKCSAKSTENGIRFAMGNSADMDSEVSDYLPREVAARDGWGSRRAAVLSTTDKRGQTSHATCTHPATKAERIKCRKARAAQADA